MAPFGASCILIFTTPGDEYAQPINVLGGYFITGLISLILMDFLPHQFWVVGLVLGVGITVMALLRLTHPPAGAVPVVVYLSSIEAVDYFFLISPIMCGSATLVLLALIMHRLPLKADYPRLSGSGSASSSRNHP